MMFMEPFAMRKRIYVISNNLFHTALMIQSLKELLIPTYKTVKLYQK